MWEKLLDKGLFMYHENKQTKQKLDTMNPIYYMRREEDEELRTNISCVHYK